jgi:hypothetical protein
MSNGHRWFRRHPIIGGVLAGGMVGSLSLVANALFSGASWRSTGPEIAATVVITATLFGLWLRFDTP